MIFQRYVKLCLVAIMIAPALGCGNVTAPTVTFGNPGSNSIPVTRLDFIVDGNSISSNTTNGQIQNGKIKSFILITVTGSANPTIDFVFRGVGTIATPRSSEAQKYSYNSSSALLESPILVPATLPSFGKKASYNYGDLAIMDATRGQFVDYGYSTPTPPDLYTPGTTPLLPTTVYYDFTTPSHVLTSAGVWLRDQFDTGTYTYRAPAQIIADESGQPLDTFALLATPEDPALARNANAILIHLNLTVAVSPNTAKVYANTSLQPALYNQQFTASVPGDGVYNGAVEWHCYDADAQGNPISYTATDSAGNILTDSSGNAIRYYKDEPSYINKDTGLFTAPTGDAIVAGAPTTYAIRAFSRTQPDKYGTATATVSYQSTRNGHK